MKKNFVLLASVLFLGMSTLTAAPVVSTNYQPINQTEESEDTQFYTISVYDSATNELLEVLTGCFSELEANLKKIQLIFEYVKKNMDVYSEITNEDC